MAMAAPALSLARRFVRAPLAAPPAAVALQSVMGSMARSSARAKLQRSYSLEPAVLRRRPSAAIPDEPSNARSLVRFASMSAASSASPHTLPVMQTQAALGDAALKAFSTLGRYRGNEVAWDAWADSFLAGSEPMSIVDLKVLARTLAVDVQLTKASVWERIARRADSALKSGTLLDLVEIARAHARIRAFTPEVFGALMAVARKEGAVYTMEAEKLTEFLELLSYAGQMADLSRECRGLFFTAMQDRLLDDEGFLPFSVDMCLALVESSARLRQTDLRHVIHEIGRQVLHPILKDLAPDLQARLCYAYGQLGFRHDTVLKTVSQDIIEENKQMQRDRVLGATSAEPRYGGGEVALVAWGLLQNKMHRGSTSWCNWGESYRELVDILMRRVSNGVDDLAPRPLAAAAFVLGRARRGTEELTAALYARMTVLIEGPPGGDDSRAAVDGNAASWSLGEDPPQDELAHFLHGLAMMGPTRKKNLDTFWLQQWLCTNLHTLTLSDLIYVNRYLVMMGCCEQEYLTMLVDQFYVVPNERTGECPLDNLTKTDIMELTNTYNGARVREEHVGRHFFWALGRRFQALRSAGKPRRPAYQRLG